MHYLIDGHNLIPALGLNLADPDDEEQLVLALQNYARGRKRRLTVFFDGSPQAHQANFGAVKAVFVPRANSADAAIMHALAQAKNAARNLTVVSSDRQVQAAARAAHAQVLSSQAFASQMHATQPATPNTETPYPSAEEVEAWEALFEQNQKPKKI